MTYFESKAQKLIHDLVDELHYEFKGKTVIEAKTGSKFWKYMVFIVACFTSGNAKDSITVIGPRVGVPIKLLHEPEAMYVELMRARKSLRQYSNLGHGNFWLGFFIWLFLYVIFPFPICFCYYRAKFDKECSKEIIRAYVLLYGRLHTGTQEAYVKSLCFSTFQSLNKVFTWPFSIHLDKWFADTYIDVLTEEGIIMLYEGE